MNGRARCGPGTQGWTTGALAALALAAFGVVTGCDSDDGGPSTDPEAWLAEEACEHLESGPFVDVNGAPHRETAPDATAEHAAARVALEDVDFDGETGRGGWVTWQIEATGEHVVFLSEDIPLEVSDATGTLAASSDALAEEAPCETLRAARAVELDIGTWTLRLGPAPGLQSVRVVVEAVTD